VHCVSQLEECSHAPRITVSMRRMIDSKKVYVESVCLWNYILIRI
jgi:hypothetical protein